MKNLFRWLLLLGVTFFSLAYAQKPGSPKDIERIQKQCIEQFNRGTQVLVARDWKQLVVDADRYIKICGSVWGDEWLSIAHERKATAYLWEDDLKRVIEATDACLSVHYGNTGCHLYRGQALIALARYQEAKTAVDRADRLIRSKIENVDREMQRHQTSLEREASQSDRTNLISQQGWAESLRKNIDLRLGASDR
ncbi:MAG: hypothetical protein AAB176_13520 [Pseudomonadota bacterium]